MNRNHQFTPGTESERAAYFCDRCGRSREAHGDSTPLATPVEPCQNCMGVDPASCVFCYRSAHPPAVSGEGERLLRQAFRSGWNGGFTAIPDEGTLNQQEEQDWQAFVRNWLHPSTPTPGAPR